MSEAHDKRNQIKVPPDLQAELDEIRKLCPLPASANSVGVAALKEGIPHLRNRLKTLITTKEE